MLAFLLIPALIGVGRAGIEIPRWDVHKIFSPRVSDSFYGGDSLSSGFRDNCRWLTAPDWNTVLKCDGNEVSRITNVILLSLLFTSVFFHLMNGAYAPNYSCSILFCTFLGNFKVVVGACSGGGGWGHKVRKEVFSKTKLHNPHTVNVTQCSFYMSFSNVKDCPGGTVHELHCCAVPEYYYRCQNCAVGLKQILNYIKLNSNWSPAIKFTQRPADTLRSRHFFAPLPRFCNQAIAMPSKCSCPIMI